jgi:hypothetical protein
VINRQGHEHFAQSDTPEMISTDVTRNCEQPRLESVDRPDSGQRQSHFQEDDLAKVVKVGVVSTDERDHLSGNTVLMVADDCPQRRQRLV